MLVSLMTIFVVLHWQVPVIAVAIFGFPVLLAVFLIEAGAAAPPLRRLVLTALSAGIAFAIGWAAVSGVVTAHNYGIGLGAGLAGGPKNQESLGVPLGAVLAMLLPVVLVRLVMSKTSGVSTGFLAGVVGASSFGMTLSLVHLAPQLAAGLVEAHRPVMSLMVEAGIRGVAIPLTSAGIGGLAGVALWFRRGSQASRIAAIVVIVAVLAAGSAVGTGLTDAWTLPQEYQLLAHLGISMLVLFVTRIVLHIGLLQESHSGRSFSGEARVCEECDRATQDGLFCPNCGAVRFGYPLHKRDGRVLVRLGCGLVVAVVTMSGVSVLMTKQVALYACPPECGRPPIGTPVEINQRFTSTDGAFSVSYPSAGSAYEVATGADWVIATFTGGDGGVLRLSGEPARGRTARDVVRDLLREVAPNAVFSYQLPNAMVGYRIGYGEVVDDYPAASSAGYVRTRIVVLAAIKDDYALIAAAGGPFRQFGPDFGPGPPSAVNLQVAIDMDKYVNSFRWRPDPNQ